ncbi:hypothetical protein GCM10010140_33880 [Streptosporangium pseudovulgare]|uniref:Uncharacterized protein n=1 Tax=Streptosporangium pseudovulgare TaxID=35765 RepID=A0ABQ2QX80_9ACTN|nr:hypothetical protein GCM10010140_33880 [Streptosporangium pseudovulgare]
MKTAGERQGQQKREQNLDARDGDPQPLQQFPEFPVHPFLVALVRLGILRDRLLLGKFWLNHAIPMPW